MKIVGRDLKALRWFLIEHLRREGIAEYGRRTETQLVGQAVPGSARLDTRVS